MDDLTVECLSFIIDGGKLGEVANNMCSVIYARIGNEKESYQTQHT